MPKTVDFGAERVTPEEMTRRVGEVFDAAVGRYDLMNDLMSLGSHRLFKRAMVEMAHLRPGNRVLDLAGGTGDVARLLVRDIGASGQVILADINRPMLCAGRDRLLNAGCANIAYAQADAAVLPFADESFDAVLVAFGVRNFADKEAALREMRRVLRTGGVAVLLEFAKVKNPVLARAYDAFKSTWPMLGRAVADASAPYRYLVESIDRHPDQDTFRRMMEDAGFATVHYHDLAAGAAAIHRGTK